MNVNYDQSYEALIQLLRSAHIALPSHYVALDYDGEVVIDPDMHYPDVALSSYKYCTQIRNVNLYNDRKIQSLFTILITVCCDEEPLIGSYGFRAAA
jgi:hypothetical protein